MHKKLYVLLAVGMMVFMFFPPSCIGQTLIITPSFLEVEGAVGDWVVKQVTVKNTEDEEVGVTVSIDQLQHVLIPNSAFIIGPNAERNINIIFTIEEDEFGWILYTVGDNQFSQLVSVEANAEDPTIMMFPSAPKAGNTVSFLLLHEVVQNALGYVIVSQTGNSYMLQITNGMGMVKFNKSDSGNAFYHIHSEGMRPVYGEFIIAPSGEDDGDNGDGGNGGTGDDPVQIVIDGPSKVNVGVTSEITVYVDGKVGSMLNMKITKPDGSSMSETTSYFGGVNVEFDMSGKWNFKVIKDDVIASKDVQCSKETKTISLVTDNPEAGKDVKISVFEDAEVTVSGPGGFLIEGSESAGGFTFRPVEPGEYVVSAQSDTASSSNLIFSVLSEPVIQVTTVSGRQVGMSIARGEGYYIEVLGVDDDPLEVDTDIIIINVVTGQEDEFSLKNAQVYWNPLTTGSYIIDFPGVDFYTDVEIEMRVTSASRIVEEDATLWWAFGFIVFIVGVAFAYKYRQFIPYLRKKSVKSANVTGENKPPE